MSSAICFNLDQSKVLSSGNELKPQLIHWVLYGSVLGKNISKALPSAGITKELHGHASCCHDLTEIMLKAE